MLVALALVVSGSVWRAVDWARLRIHLPGSWFFDSGHAFEITPRLAHAALAWIGALVGPVVRSMWVSTFHSACVRILRANAIYHTRDVAGTD